MTSPLAILTGPARSGKTERLLAAYRVALRGGPPRSTLWLAPTHRSVADILARLPGPDLPGCLSPGVLTFENFAREVLEASGRPMQPLSTLMKRQLVRFLIAQAREAGRLRHFASIAETHGLVDLVTAFISELKRLEIWPEEFERACSARGLSDKDRELVGLYAAYQDRLREHQLYDAEGRFWSARDLLTSGQAWPLGELRLVVVDGFTDFTRTQHEILALLAGRTEKMYVSLPLEAEPRREDLFAKTIETLQTLQERAGVAEMPGFSQKPGICGEWPMMERLENELFQNPRRAPPAPPRERGGDPRIEILGASREQGEIEQIGRRIKRLLTEGDQPARPGEIAVVFRSVSDVAPLVREIFGELGIPCDIETSETLDETPLAAAIVSLLRLAVEDWPFRQLLTVLGSSYLQPAWPEWQAGAAAQAAERAVRSLQIPAGAQSLLSALRRRSERLSPSPPWGEGRGEGQDWGDGDTPTDHPPSPREQRLAQQAADARAALALLTRLHAALTQLPRAATQAEWTDALTQLADDLGLPPTIAAGDALLRRRDEDTWKCLLQALREGSRLFEKIGETPPELTAGEFLALLVDLLRWQRLPRHHDEVGRVRVLSAASVRSLRVPYLFFAGLSERAFPSPDRHDRLYSEGEYRQLRDRAKLPLPLRHERNQQEMLLFYEVVTRAARRLWLSYPALDAKAEPLLPSPYLREVERATGLRTAPPLSTQRDLCGLPPLDHAPQTPRDLRLQAVERALGEEGDASLLAALPIGDSGGLRECVLAGLELTRERAGRQFGPFEGVLGEGARADIAQRYGPQVRWTVSHLEQYALCPHQFFLQRLLKLEPLDELTLEPDYLQRGGLIHDALAELHRSLNEEHGGPASLAQWEWAELEQTIETIVRQALERTGGEHTAQAALREIDRRTILGWLAAYRRQHEQYDSQWDHPPLPAHFEVSFGLNPPSDDALSTDRPWELEHAGEKLLFCGRIDRLDLGHRDGQHVFNVIDYKSGRVRSRDEAQSPDGRQLQLELYALAAQQLLLGGRAVPWHTGYWYVKREGFKCGQPLHQPGDDGWKPSLFWRDRLRQVLDKVFALVRGIRAAEFPMASLDDQCTSHCPFKTVCRVNHARALEKTWESPNAACLSPLERGAG